MQDPNFWASYAETMDLTIQGDRLIALEIAGFARGLWQRAGRGLETLFRSR